MNKYRWTWNGDICCIPGMCIVIGARGEGREKDRKAVEAHAQLIVDALNDYDRRGRASEDLDKRNEVK